MQTSNECARVNRICAFLMREFSLKSSKSEEEEKSFV
jgi:hypothetical protein